MFNKNFLILKITIIICIFSSFVLGFLFHQKKFFPYYQLKFIFKEITQSSKSQNKNKLIKKSEKKDDVILEKYFLFEDLFVSENTYSTHTIPLQIIKYDLNKIHKKIYEKGGLCLAGKRILIVYNNNFYFSDNKRLIRLDTNFLPNNSIVTSLNCSNEKDDVIKFFINVVEPYSDKKSYNKIFRGNLNLLHKDLKVELVKSFETDGENGAGKIVISNLDQLFLSFYETKNKNSAQDLTALSGKILSIDLKNNKHSIHTLGHRNSQGLFIDDDNNFFATEHGPYGGDELNLILNDKNYGWPITSDGLASRGTYEKTYGNLGRHSSKFEKPLYSWTPGIGISDLLRVKSFDSTWNNDLLVSSLKNKTLYRIRLDFLKDSFTVKYIEDIWIGHRIRHVKESIDKKILLLTDDGYLIKISKIDKSDDKWVDIRKNPCLSCHHLGITNQTHAAPSLVGIFNRNAGSDPNFIYSNAFHDKNFKWNENNMIEYLLNPQKFLPGTIKSYKAVNFIEASKAVEDLKRISITSK